MYIDSPYPVGAATFVWNAAIFIATGSQTRLLSNSVSDGRLLEDIIQLDNAPLPDYHPQVLLQCLEAGKSSIIHSDGQSDTIIREGKASLVDEILLRLRDACRGLEDGQRAVYSAIEPIQYYNQEGRHAEVC